MTSHIHLHPHLTAQDVTDRFGLGSRVYAVQRVGAVVVGTVLLVFGLLGLTAGLPFLTTHGERILGLSSNGLLAVVSVVVGGILIGAALRGPRLASTVMIVLGVLFLVSALGNMAVLRTSLNLFAFRMSNVYFSIVVGLVLLLLGSYGRLTGHLPDDSPYAHPHERPDEPPDGPSTPEEFAAEEAMRDAEIAVVQHVATDEQRRRVQAMAGAHNRDERRHIWLALDGEVTAPAAAPRTAGRPDSRTAASGRSSRAPWARVLRGRRG